MRKKEKKRITVTFFFLDMYDFYGKTSLDLFMQTLYFSFGHSADSATTCQITKILTWTYWQKRC